MRTFNFKWNYAAYQETAYDSMFYLLFLCVLLSLCVLVSCMQVLVEARWECYISQAGVTELCDLFLMDDEIETQALSKNQKHF